jgi:hypothetical protein
MCFALVDLVPYLICKLGQGHNFLLSPMLMSYGATGHLIVANGCSAGIPNVRIDVRTYGRTDVRKEVSTISPILTIVDGG